MNRTMPKNIPPSFSDAYDGILLVDKPAGMTSHDVVDKIRRRFGFRKVGHAGTLDPQCTGLLVIMTGRATKLADRLITQDKLYEGVMRLGIETDSQDADGKVTAQRDYSGITAGQIELKMRSMVGDLMHTPPMVSAVKQDGVPLYKLARKGRVVERKAKLVRIFEFNLESFSPPDASFRLRCSKGVYVRTLCAEIGEALGCGAHLAALRRIESGNFSVSDAVPLQTILETDRPGLARLVIPLLKVGLKLRPETPPRPEPT